MRPVTSTRVATNGAEAVAGSSLNFLRSNGSIETARVPHITIPIKLHPTERAIRK